MLQTIRKEVIPLKVLLADPNRDILLTYQKLFELRGDTAECAFDGTQALACLTRGGYQLVIVNSHLPRVRAEKIIGIAREQNIPCIALIDTHLRSSHLLSGVPACAFLSLPFSPDILFGYVDAILEKAAGNERFSVAGVAINVGRFCIEDSGTPLTSKEIDLLRALKDGPLIDVRHLSTYINALNNKLSAPGQAAKIRYVLEKGYCVVNQNE